MYMIHYTRLELSLSEKIVLPPIISQENLKQANLKMYL